MKTQKNSALINLNQLLEIKICRRCIYTIVEGEEIGLFIPEDKDNVCPCCGKRRDAPYQIEIQVMSVDKETGKIKAKVIEMPSNWNGRGEEVFSRQK